MFAEVVMSGIFYDFKILYSQRNNDCNISMYEKVYT